MIAMSVVPAADVHHHVPAWFRYGSPAPNAATIACLHQVHFARLRRYVESSTRASRLRRLARHSDNNSGVYQFLPLVRLLNEVREHMLGHLEIGDDAIAQRLMACDIGGRAAQHFSASVPQPTISPVARFTATIEGSSSTIPFPAM